MYSLRCEPSSHALNSFPLTLGDKAGALSAYEEILSIRFASSVTSNAFQQKDHMVGKLAVGDVDGAISACQEGVRLATQACRPNQAKGLSKPLAFSIGAIIRNLAFRESHQKQSDRELCGAKVRGGTFLVQYLLI